MEKRGYGTKGKDQPTLSTSAPGNPEKEFYFKDKLKRGIIAQVCNLSKWEVEARARERESPSRATRGTVSKYQTKRVTCDLCSEKLAAVPARQAKESLVW